jgi:hypothetical protein
VVSQAPLGWPPPGLAERLAELEARHQSMAPLSPLELAVAANLLALGTAWLARDAARCQLHLPVEAMVGAQALHRWARAVLAQEPADAGRAEAVERRKRP